MKTIAPIIALVATVLFSFTTIEWITFSPKSKDFQVSLPSNPEEATQKQEEGLGAPYTVQMYTAKDVPNATVYLVGYVDYAPNFTFDKKKESEANMNNFVTSVGGELIESKEVEFAGYNGIFFRAKTAANGYLWTSYVIIVGNRPYQLIIGSPKGIASPNEAKFFESFKILGK